MTRREWYRRQSDDDLIRLAPGVRIDGPKYWSCVRTFHTRATEAVFKRSVALCRQPSPHMRQVGCDVLGQLGTRHVGRRWVAPFRARSLPVLHRCLKDRHPGVVESAVYALGHLRVRHVSRLLTDLVRHPDRRVREALAWTLGGKLDRRALRCLVELTRDCDGETRNWTLFGLGELTPIDTMEIRQALWARVRDRHREARGEALRGLALRKDKRILEPLQCELEAKRVGILAVEAAEALGHPSLLTGLRRLRPRDPWFRQRVREAIAACRPRPQHRQPAHNRSTRS
jgi:hypothetical protein